VVLNCGLGTEFNTTTTIDVRSYIISKELVWVLKHQQARSNLSRTACIISLIE
jgi:hypothetical protein